MRCDAVDGRAAGVVFEEVDEPLDQVDAAVDAAVPQEAPVAPGHEAAAVIGGDEPASGEPAQVGGEGRRVGDARKSPGLAADEVEELVRAYRPALQAARRDVDDGCQYLGVVLVFQVVSAGTGNARSGVAEGLEDAGGAGAAFGVERAGEGSEEGGQVRHGLRQEGLGVGPECLAGADERREGGIAVGAGVGVEDGPEGGPESRAVGRAVDGVRPQLAVGRQDDDVGFPGVSFLA